MKRISVILLLCFSLVFAAHINAEISFGAKIGLNQTRQDFKFSQFGDLGSLDKSGAEIGFFLQFPIVSALSVSAEARYLQKGEQFDYLAWGGNLPNPEPLLDARLSYVSFLILGKLTVPLTGFNLYGIAGPRYDFKVGPKEVVGFEMLTDSYNSPILGGVLGAGAEFKLGNVAWFLIEAYYGFDWNKAFESSELDIDTRTLGVLIGIRT